MGARVGRPVSLVGREKTWRRCWLCLALPMFFALAACDEESPPQRDLRATPGQIETVLQTKTLDLTPEEVGRAFAIGSAATEVQRQRLKEALLGKVVQWDLTVYDVSLDGGVYRIVSKPLSQEEGDAIVLLSAFADVTPREDANAKRLERLRTGDRVRIRGVVQDLSFRAVLRIGPAILIESSAAGSSEDKS